MARRDNDLPWWRSYVSSDDKKILKNFIKRAKRYNEKNPKNPVRVPTAKELERLTDWQLNEMMDLMQKSNAKEGFSKRLKTLSQRTDNSNRSVNIAQDWRAALVSQATEILTDYNQVARVIRLVELLPDYSISAIYYGTSSSRSFFRALLMFCDNALDADYSDGDMVDDLKKQLADYLHVQGLPIPKGFDSV